MTNANKIKGNWFKHSGYGVRDGVLRPLNSLDYCEYDPWEAFRANQDVYRTVEQPYVPLLNLARTIFKVGADGRPDGDKRATELALSWCTGHGLLGLLPALSSEIHCEKDLHHHRKGGRWQTRLLSPEFGPLLLVPELCNEFGLNSSGKLRAGGGWFTWLDWGTQIYERQPIERLYTHYFPSTDATAPRPNSMQFRALYAEPLDDFFHWSALFMQAVHHLSRWGETAQPSDLKLELNANDAHLILTGLATGGLLEASRPDIQTRKLIEERESPSLLASYALMFLWDLEAGRKAIECENCDDYFVSNDLRARYCSTTCRNTARSRRYRQRKEEAIN